MAERSRAAASLGAALFFIAAPGTVAALVPFLLTGGRAGAPWLGLPWTRGAGVVLILAGLASLVDSFVRFVAEGRGTPAPMAPPITLVVSGQYRFVRNPMYVALVATVVGEALLLGRPVLLAYAALLGVLFHLRVLFYEEPRLARQFGAGFDAYRRNVRRWWPRTRPWTP